MWYHGRSLSAPEDVVKLSMGSIGCAESDDGLTWERCVGSPALAPDLDDSAAFDSVLVGMGSVLPAATFGGGAGEHWLYYFGGGQTPFVPKPGMPGIRGVRQSVGLARGACGAGDPICHWEAREEVLRLGADGEWDSLFLASPQVLKHADGDFRMYYHSLAGGRFSVGLATSGDGLRWTKRGEILGPGPEGSWDASGCSRRFVMRNPKPEGEGSVAPYIMFYEGSSSGRHGIGVAVSVDGLEWERLGDEPVFLTASGTEAWDSKAVSSPCVVRLPGSDRFRLYYVGLDVDGDTGVGVAETRLQDFPYGWERVLSF